MKHYRLVIGVLLATQIQTLNHVLNVHCIVYIYTPDTSQVNENRTNFNNMSNIIILATGTYTKYLHTKCTKVLPNI